MSTTMGSNIQNHSNVSSNRVTAPNIPHTISVNSLPTLHPQPSIMTSTTNSQYRNNISPSNMPPLRQNPNNNNNNM